MSVRRLFAVCACALAGVAAGCSQDDSDEGSDATTRRASAERPPDTQPAERTSTSAASEESAAARRPVRLLRVGRFNQPTYLTAPRGDRERRFVVERAGRVLVLRGGRVLREPFLDIRGSVSTGGESGLLSMAFAPDYGSSGRFYVYYTDNRGYITIDSFRRSPDDPDRTLPGSRVNVMSVAHRRFNHKGGQIQFGPDGRLYAAFGDGGGGGDPDRNAQNLGRLLGKMVRIEPRAEGGYSVPRDNPFRNRSGARPEVYAYGLRNPYRFSFDRRKGALTIGDVGQSAVEEIDYAPAGRSGNRTPAGGYNFGWSVFEGRRRYYRGRAPGHVRPVIDHGRGEGFCSIIGGYVIRDRSLGRGWYGRYLYGDYCQPTLRLALLRKGSAPSRRTRLRVPELVSFGEDGRGRVYAVSLSGPVYRIGRR